MANTIYQLKKSPTPGAVPSALANGELAINFADGLIFYKNVTGHIVSFSSSGGNYFSSVDADGTLLVADTDSDVLNLIAGSNITIEGDAATDTITISATGGGSSVEVSDVAPGSPTANTLWWNSVLGKMFIYYDDGTSSQWVETSPGAVLTGGGDPGEVDLSGPYGHANLAFFRSNQAFSKANTANNDAIAAFLTANTVWIHANQAFSKANTANNDAIAAFTKANTMNVRTTVNLPLSISVGNTAPTGNVVGDIWIDMS